MRGPGAQVLENPQTLLNSPGGSQCYGPHTCRAALNRAQEYRDSRVNRCPSITRRSRSAPNAPDTGTPVGHPCKSSQIARHAPSDRSGRDRPGASRCRLRPSRRGVATSRQRLIYSRISATAARMVELPVADHRRARHRSRHSSVRVPREANRHARWYGSEHKPMPGGS